MLTGPVDGPQVARLVALSWIAVGAVRLARLTTASAPAGGFLCPGAALNELNNVRIGTAQAYLPDGPGRIASAIR